MDVGDEEERVGDGGADVVFEHGDGGDGCEGGLVVVIRFICTRE